MPLTYEDLERTHPPGRRVRFLPTDATRKKIPPGVADGLIRGIVPRPVYDEGAPDRDAPDRPGFGLLIDIVLPDGKTETVILDVADVELVPHDVS